MKADVETNKAISTFGICYTWRTSRNDARALIQMLHGFYMVSGLMSSDGAMGEIEFLIDLLGSESDPLTEQEKTEATEEA